MSSEKQGVGNMPVGVVLVSLLTLLNGIATVVVGAMWLWASGEPDILGEVDTTSDQAQTYGWISLALGAIIVLVGIGLLRGSRFARFLVMTLMVLRIGIDVFAVLAVDGYSWVQAAIGIGWSLLIIILLTTRPASRFFLQR